MPILTQANARAVGWKACEWECGDATPNVGDNAMLSEVRMLEGQDAKRRERAQKRWEAGDSNASVMVCRVT
jgi:hypothetical protein